MSIQDHPALFEWEHAGLACRIQDSGIGFFNGYVRLVNHPLAGSGYDQLNRAVAIHGGLTYGSDKHGWVGFDTGHSGDYWPGLPSKYESYLPRPEWAMDWDVTRLRIEVDSLADQLAALTSLPDPTETWECTDEEFRRIVRESRAWRRLRASKAVER